MTDQLRKAAQQALKALQELDGLDTETECVTIDVGEVIDALRTALNQQAMEASQLTPFGVLVITTAYEQGVGKGHQAHARGVEIENPYAPGTGQQAWALGYDEGKKQAASKVPHNIKD